MEKFSDFKNAQVVPHICTTFGEEFKDLGHLEKGRAREK